VIESVNLFNVVSQKCSYIRPWLSDLLYWFGLEPGLMCQHIEVPCRRESNHRPSALRANVLLLKSALVTQSNLIL